MEPFAGVVVERAPLTAVYHYRIPDDLLGQIKPGMRVTIPLGPRRAKGFVVELAEAVPIAETRLKAILDTGDGEVLAPPDLLELTRWVAEYYQCGWGEVLTAALPAAVRRGTRAKTVQHFALAVSPQEAIDRAAALQARAPKQAAALRALLNAKSDLPATELMAASGAGRSALDGLAAKGLVLRSAVAAHRDLARLSEDPHPGIVLTAGQREALSQVQTALEGRSFQTFLMFGATASGKTEVYLRALATCLAQGRTAIVLVPEISLTPQTVERFRSRVGDVAVLHSNMAAGERAAEWRRLRSGEVRVVVGARSAIFAPLPDLGLIVVDEEHERTFKQDSSPRYHARDVAVVRARQKEAVVLLGSATPSLESYHNARAGKYILLPLPERVGGQALPETEVVDMRQEWLETKQQTLISRRLEEAVAAALQRREQIILFLNRRGFHTWIHCLNCKDVVRCPQCDISMTYHQHDQKVRCHYCQHVTAAPQTCPACSAPRLRFAGSGTERAEDVIAKLFPKARLLRMDSDTMGGRDAHAQALSAFGRGDYDILLGTQMIAKGHDFPNVTLIGVLLADGSINLPDFRAAEHTFQLIMQVVGRAGRADKPGRGIVQAFDPDHWAVRLAAAQDYPAFAEHELEDRAGLRYPPFGRLARIIVRGPDRKKCATLIQAAAGALRRAAPPLSVLGPAPCALGRIQNQFRFHALVKAADPPSLARILHQARDALHERGKTKLAIDIDPVSLL